jgi:hypothetical protein
MTPPYQTASVHQRLLMIAAVAVLLVSIRDAFKPDRTFLQQRYAMFKA